jgi:hypothetical protein
MHVLKVSSASLIKFFLLFARRKKLIKPGREDFLEAITIRNILNFNIVQTFKDSTKSTFGKTKGTWFLLIEN